MGAGFSGLVTDCIGAPTPSNPGLGDIPESCVAVILTHLDPLEICKFSRLNQVFREASSADLVWESKLPENYQILMKKLFSECPQNLSKKEIYARLCRPNRFDGGNKEVWIDHSGKICVSVSWKGMKITGIDDRRYWNHIPSDESRFHQIAYLQQIWWLEVDGHIEFQFPRGTYSLFFRLRLGNPTKSPGRRRVRNHEQVHGWNIKPVRFQFATSNNQNALSEFFLNQPGKWVNHHVGDFSVESSIEPTKIKFSMMQIDCTHTKGGLCLDSVLILPKG